MATLARMNRACLLAVATACGLALPARGAQPALADIVAEVEAATRPGKLPHGVAARDEVVRRLVDLHDRLVADPRFSTSPEVRALRGRVAARLTHLRRRLEQDLATLPRPPRAAPGGGGQADARQLIDLIQATVRPESWDVAGGAGSIRYFDNGHGLVVSATEDVHQELGDLLHKLR
ncbi:MAG: hypothetical protein ACKOZU_10110 [Planctomycetaceae bacterium]